MNKVGWIIFSVIVVIVLGGLIAWARMTNPPIDVSGIDNNSIVAANDQNGNIADHVTGNTSGDVIFLEYGDFQCPSCGGAFPGVNTLIEEYGDKVTFVFRNFPLTAIHPNARAAAAVAEAAGLQGKYWEMNHKLFEFQDEWSGLDANKRTTVFEGYATSLQLDIEKFKTDLTSKAVSDKIAFDMALGKSVGTQATPTFFLDGTKLDEATSSGIVQGDLTEIRKQLDELVK